MPTQVDSSLHRKIESLLSNEARGIAGKWWLVLAAAVLVAAIAYGWWSYSGTAGSITYRTDPVTKGDLTVIVTATGSIAPTNKVDISSELSGIVRKVLVDYNSIVTAGQVLAELNTDSLNAAHDSAIAKLAAANAKVAEAEATVAEAQGNFTRSKALAAQKISSTKDLAAAKAALERAMAALASAQADVGVSQADLKLNETNRAKSAITSPINGVVLTRSVDPGQTVAASLQAPVLFSIAEDLRQMEVLVDVDEADVGSVKEGQRATFTVDAFPDRKFQAQIKELRYGSEVVQGVVTYKAVLTTDNSDLLLRPGMTATAQIAVHEVRSALLIANAALRFSPASNNTTQTRSLLRTLLGGPPRARPASKRDDTGPNRTVWIVQDGVPEAVSVVVGATDGKRTEIAAGPISAGQSIIVDTATTPN